MCTAPNFNQEPFNGNREKIMQCMTSTSRFRGHHDSPTRSECVQQPQEDKHALYI